MNFITWEFTLPNMKKVQLYLLLALTCLAESCNTPDPVKEEAEFNSAYKGERLKRVWISRTQKWRAVPGSSVWKYRGEKI